MENKFVTIKIDENTLKMMEEEYASIMTNGYSEYAIHEIDGDYFHCTIYKNKENKLKAVFSGDSSLKEARRWDENAFYNPKKEKEEYSFLDFNAQIGSDEVGTGDLLLPVIVVAVRANKSEIVKCLDLGIKDSKMLNDEEIMKIGPKVAKIVKFSKLTLSNEMYNQLTHHGENMNSIKAKMHNRALYNMQQGFLDYPVYVDEFVYDKKYYEYIKNEKEKVEYITFATKGEQKYPSVAIASCIARYCLLLEKEKLEKELHMEVPFGAGIQADAFVTEFLKKHTIDELVELAKSNFKNIKDL